jgi:hypothetical protein
MELEGSLLCLQDPLNGPYPETGEFSPYDTIQLLIHFHIILSHTSRSLSYSFPCVVLTSMLY